MRNEKQIQDRLNLVLHKLEHREYEDYTEMEMLETEESTLTWVLANEVQAEDRLQATEDPWMVDRFQEWQSQMTKEAFVDWEAFLKKYGNG